MASQMPTSCTRIATHSTRPAPGHPEGETVLVIGPSTSAGFLELIVADGVDGPAVFHAMPLRTAYEQFLNIRGR